MPKELSEQHAKLLYDLAISAQRSNNNVQAINVLQKLVEIGDPFYTPFALSMLANCYNFIGQRELLPEVYKSVTRLPKEQQLLLNPGWVGVCFQRVGDYKTATEINESILKLTPNNIDAIPSLAELYLLQGNLDKAEVLAKTVRERGEPHFQVLGRIIGAFVLALRGNHSGAATELLWVGQFIISTGNVSPGTWDYSDLEPLTAKLGTNSAPATLLLEPLLGRVSLPEFIEAWKELMPA